MLLTRLALKHCRHPARLQVVEDGVEALALLRGEGKHAGAARPDLILLDLNLPGMDGRDVLRALKQDPGLQTIPVVLLTTSSAEGDVVRSYRLHANAFVTKPLEMDAFIRLLQGIEDFWFGVARLPPASSAA